MANLEFHTFKMKNSGIYHNSYFFPMPFGHFIFHPFDWSEKEFQFIESKGGVWRVFVGRPDLICACAKRLFDKFGAYHVVPNGKDAVLYSENSPIEIFRKQFVDSKIKMVSYDDHQGWALFWYNDRLYLFFDDMILLDNGEWKFKEPRDYSSVYGDLSKLEVDFVMFQHSTTSQSYQALTPDLYHKKLHSLFHD